MTCPYRVLELNRGADEEEILDSYRRLSILFHPDRNLHNQSIVTSDLREQEEVDENSFILISQAYETLIDPQNRRRYHTHLSALLNEESEKTKQTTVEQIFKSAKVCVNPSQYDILDDEDHQVMYDIYTEAMFRSRDRRPFTDGRVLFSSVFGSNIFNSDKSSERITENVQRLDKARLQWSGRLKNRFNAVIRRRKLAAQLLRNRIVGRPTRADSNDTKKLETVLNKSVSTQSITESDGTRKIITITRKIIGDKLMTRTETTIVSGLPDGSKKSETFVEVTSDDLNVTDRYMNNDNDDRETKSSPKFRTKVHMLVKRCNDCVVAPCMGDFRGTLSQVD